jgi:hypothetical protein
MITRKPKKLSHSPVAVALEAAHLLAPVIYAIGQEFIQNSTSHWPYRNVDHACKTTMSMRVRLNDEKTLTPEKHGRHRQPLDSLRPPVMINIGGHKYVAISVETYV